MNGKLKAWKLLGVSGIDAVREAVPALLGHWGKDSRRLPCKESSACVPSTQRGFC